MRRTLGLITALLLAAPAVIWTQGNPDRPFRFQGRNWVNQEAFIASGARCATRDLTPERRDEVDREIAAHLNQSSGRRRDRWRHRRPFPCRHERGGGWRRARQPDQQADHGAEQRVRSMGLDVQSRVGRPHRKRRLVRDGAWHDGGARCESRAPTGDRGRFEHLHARTPAAGCSAGRRSRRATAAKPIARWRRDPLLVAPGRLGRAVQPRRHGDTRSRPLDGAVPHVPGRLQQQRTTTSATRRRSAARPSAAPSAAIRARAPDSIRSRTSWTTPTTRACSSSRRDRISGWTRSSARIDPASRVTSEVD